MYKTLTRPLLLVITLLLVACNVTSEIDSFDSSTSSFLGSRVIVWHTWGEAEAKVFDQLFHCGDAGVEEVLPVFDLDSIGGTAQKGCETRRGAKRKCFERNGSHLEFSLLVIPVGTSKGRRTGAHVSQGLTQLS